MSDSSMTSNGRVRIPAGLPDQMIFYERRLWRSGLRYVAGVDEAGRGPLAGPVVAAAVIFAPGTFIPEVNDSKQLPPDERAWLCARILHEARAVGVARVEHELIDEINILRATYRAMHEAIRLLALPPDHVLIDGNRFEGNGVPFTTLVDGDALSFSIAAASIVAKVTRDRIMEDYDRLYPGYGFVRHKGYPTPEHRDAISRLGYSPIHRRSFTCSPLMSSQEECFPMDERG